MPSAVGRLQAQVREEHADAARGGDLHALGDGLGDLGAHARHGQHWS